MLDLVTRDIILSFRWQEKRCLFC